MVSFGKLTTPAFDFLDSGPFPRDASQRLVLWPVYGWRVVAPAPVERELNPFQVMVLRAAHIGRRTPEDIAKLLILDPELVRFIMGELLAAGHLDLSGRVAERGLEFLTCADAPAADRDTAGWVFTDPESGRVWPRFIIGELPALELDVETSEYPRLPRPPGQGPGPRLHVITPSERRLPAQPPRAAILDAAQAHRRGAPRSESGKMGLLSRVSFIADEPRPVFVLVRLCLSEDGRLDAAGMLGSSAPKGFLDVVNDTCSRDPWLKEQIATLLDRGGTGLKELYDQATFAVESELTTAIRRFPAVFDGLVVTERAWLEAQLDGSPADKLDDVFVKAQKACEAILDDVLVRRPLRSPVPWRDDAAIRELLHEAATRLGLAPFPKTIHHVRPGKIEAAANGNGGFRPLLLVHLLGALEQDRHPLWGAARACPTLLADVDRLATWRDGQAAHFSRERRRSRTPNATTSARDVAAEGVRLTRQLARWMLLEPTQSA